MNDHDEAQLFDGRDETEDDYRQYLRDAACDAAQDALRGYAGITLDPRLIDRALADEPDLTGIAAEHGWDDPEVTDKLFAIVCVQLLGITYSEQAARFWSRRAALEDDVQASNDRWVADNPAGQQ
ncbi:hypothetical protein [Micromonospora carbonacea]|uniref:Uncharacterized protein n=1 Tax=Micromonospora carbonacea TaxID=47853 RepID=A0A1C5AAG2_9ACTN|nr:hypothetical protein [Micromonospora carbonacea]SCF42071.1 hypothetical protein GA0070563_11234 [Micromonospora carbonacea]